MMTKPASLFWGLIFGFVAVFLLAGCSKTASYQAAKQLNQTSEQISEQISEQRSNPKPLKIATFNVSMEATNYGKEKDTPWSADILKQRLASGNNPQIKNIAEILQRIRPDIVLLNEFDYIADPQQGVGLFINNYLKISQNGAAALDYPYSYQSEVNTGQPTDFDFDNNGKKERFKADAYGFGFFPGHYAMVILSKYPIKKADVRTFQHFLWADMPGAQRPVDPQTGEFWYNEQEWAKFRLSSKSHWDVPVDVNGKTLHLLASHPTPPVFDGEEDRNGARNHDEIRFWTDYLSGSQSAYIYDDKGNKGGLSANATFVIMGDQNASVVGGNARLEGIQGLFDSPRVNASFIPQSQGGQQHKPENPNGKYNTSNWGMRVDYVLPSNNLRVIDGGVFWPTKEDPLYRLIQTRKASSDHRLVWLEVADDDKR